MDEGLALAKKEASHVPKNGGLALWWPDMLVPIFPERYSMGEEIIYHQ